MNQQKLFANRLRRLRKAAKLSLDKAGERGGLSGKYWGEVERAEKSPTLEKLAAMAKALGVPLYALMQFEHEEDDAVLRKRINTILDRATSSDLKRIYLVFARYTRFKVIHSGQSASVEIRTKFHNTDTIPGSSMKILVVDDQPEIVEYVSKLLRSWGHEVLALHCGNETEAGEVLQHIRFIRFDVTVVGYKMPVLPGTDVAVAIKRFWPSTKVIVAMETVPREESLRLRRQGVEFRELTCPFEEDELFERLH